MILDVSWKHCAIKENKVASIIRHPVKGMYSSNTKFMSGSSDHVVVSFIHPINVDCRRL